MGFKRQEDYTNKSGHTQQNGITMSGYYNIGNLGYFNLRNCNLWVISFRNHKRALVSIWKENTQGKHVNDSDSCTAAIITAMTRSKLKV